MDEQEILIRRFKKMMEEAIRQANREVIDPMLPPLNVQSVVPVAVMVAKLRGRYLQAGFDLVENKKEGFPTDEQLAQLREHRSAYEEVLAVSQAPELAVDRGYLELTSELPPES